MTLAQFIKQLRIDKDWTLRKAADRAGISNGYLSLIENGKVATPSPTSLAGLASAYSIDFGDLMRMAGHPTETDRGKAIVSDSIRGSRGMGLNDVFGTSSFHRREPATALRDDPASLIDEVYADLLSLSVGDLRQVRAFVAGLRASTR